MRAVVAETKYEVPGLNVGITGEPVLEHDEMQQSQSDTTVASIASLLICALIFIYGYQETGRPVKATLCLLVGLSYTLAFATLAVGHLNILTITFVPILIGLAIDYGVHLISRYEEELRKGKSEEASLTRAMVYPGQGIRGDGLHPLQRHPGDGNYLRRRPADLLRAHDDHAAGAAVARAPKHHRPRAGRPGRAPGTNRKSLAAAACAGRLDNGLPLPGGVHPSLESQIRLHPA